MFSASALCLIISCTSTAAAHAIGGGSSPGGGARATAGVDPELDEILSSVTGEQETYSGGVSSSGCTWKLGQPSKLPVGVVPLEEGFSPLEITEPDGTRRVLAGRDCGGAITWVWVRQSDPEELAQAGLDTVREKLPKPRAVFSPSLETSTAVVNLPQWFAVPTAQWTPVTGSASVLGLTATVTAEPTTLTWSPGDGHRPVTCSGPGPRWRSGMREPAKPPACSYTYRDASSVAPDRTAWRGRLSIHWRVTWAATDGAGGDLEGLTTSEAYDVRVREIQAVESSR
jgi:hypothetical protein